MSLERFLTALSVILSEQTGAKITVFAERGVSNEKSKEST
jgi:hypothetical protein